MPTTTDTVVLWQAASRGVLVALVVCLGATLAGCGSSGLLGPSSTADAPPPTLAAAPATPPPISQSRLALAPIVGAPEAAGKQLSGMIGSSLQSQRVLIAQSGEQADYTLRGYMVAAKDKAGVKVSYIWDLTDPTGKRVNRIQGEEIAAGASPREPWGALTAPMMQTIADKTSASLATSLASLQPTVARASAPVGVGAPTTTAGLATSQPISPAAGQATGSLPPRNTAVAAVAPAAQTSVLVSSVRGAPGDGNSALAQAMASQLRQAGLTPAAPGQAGYRVAGSVVMGKPKSGKQSIKIDWNVLDPAGRSLAVVSQNNDIEAGSLDRAWGNTATDAAQGAAVRIRSLIDDHKSGAAVGKGPAAGKSIAGRSKT